MSLPSPDPAALALRLGAEDRLAQGAAGARQATEVPAEVAAGVATEVAAHVRLLHELQVHQVELEMQNEALRQAQEDTALALLRLADLNDQLETQVVVRTAELVAARDEALAASRAKTQFLSHMSHELRTPMGGVIGMLDLSLRRAADAQQAEWLHMAKRSARHLLSVINDILDIARIESGRTALNPAPFRLQAVLDEVAGMLSPQVQAKGLVFGVHMAPACAALLLGDSLRLKQVLLNLAANAVKFTLAGGVALRVTLLQNSCAGLLLRFEVQDTGIGIEPDDLPRLFQAFEQIDQADNRRFGGTGLGLAISDRLVRLMGGRLGVHSRAGRGSLFWFTTRLAVVEPAAAPSGSLSAVPVGPWPSAEGQLRAEQAGLAVLLVTEDGLASDALLDTLRALGLRVVVAGNAAQGLRMAQAPQMAEAPQMAQAEPCALVLLDLRLPGRGAAEFVRAFRLLPGHARTPVLGLDLGADSVAQGREPGEHDGLDEVLSHPLTPERLLAALLCWLPPPAPVW